MAAVSAQAVARHTSIVTRLSLASFTVTVHDLATSSRSRPRPSHRAACDVPSDPPKSLSVAARTRHSCAGACNTSQAPFFQLHAMPCHVSCWAVLEASGAIARSDGPLRKKDSKGTCQLSGFRCTLKQTGLLCGVAWAHSTSRFSTACCTSCA